MRAPNACQWLDRGRGGNTGNRLGSLLRAQRELAGVSLRQLAEAARISKPYLSQVERGLCEPWLRILTSLADAPDIPAERMLAYAGMPVARGGGEAQTEDAIAGPATDRAGEAGAARRPSQLRVAASEMTKLQERDAAIREL